MDVELLKSYYRQIWTQCEFALIAYDDLRLQIADASAALEWARGRDIELVGLPSDEMAVRAREIAMHWSVRTWQPIQAFMTSAANIARALWGQDATRSADRASLRQSLGVEDSSPLRAVSMRNNFDAFDERLDDWWQSSSSHAFVDLSFEAIALSRQWCLEQEIFRSYDPTTGELVFWGQRYDLLSVVAEIERITPLASWGAA